MVIAIMENQVKEQNCFAGLANVNIELTSRCNKDCWICGRRQRDRLYSDLEYGDMEFSLVMKIAEELPSGIVVQLHNNGESLLYPRFKEAVNLFKHKGIVTNLVTNGKLIIEKFDEIVDSLDTMSISVFENDPEADSQFDLIDKFIKLKGSRLPFTSLRFVGEVDESRYAGLNMLKIRRLIHSSEGSFNYKKKSPTIPEIGICLDLLSHLAINRNGDVSVCVRFDPGRELVLGNVKSEKILEMWQCAKRMNMVRQHVAGKRDLVPFCNRCQFWGVPTGE